ncbi:MAG: hypothetical protein ACRYG4_24690 [Janthinobacterium lividum]
MSALTPEQRAEVQAIARETASALLAERGAAYVAFRTEALGGRGESWPNRSGAPQYTRTFEGFIAFGPPAIRGVL